MIHIILGACANLRKTSIDFMTSARIEQVKDYWTDCTDGLC